MSDRPHVEFCGGPRDGDIIALPPGDELLPGSTLAIQCMWATETKLVHGSATYRHDGFFERGGRTLIRLTYTGTTARQLPEPPEPQP
jgi:hypothetical protein